MRRRSSRSSHEQARFISTGIAGRFFPTGSEWLANVIQFVDAGGNVPVVTPCVPTQGICRYETYHMLPDGLLHAALGDGLCPINSSNRAADQKRLRGRSRLCRRPVLFLLARSGAWRGLRDWIRTRILGEFPWVLWVSVWTFWARVVSWVWQMERNAAAWRFTAAASHVSSPCASAIQEKVLSRRRLLQETPRILFDFSLTSCRGGLLCECKISPAYLTHSLRL